jgi:hypothetical protein
MAVLEIQLLPKKRPTGKKLDIVGYVHFRKTPIRIPEKPKNVLLVSYDRTHQNNRAKVVTMSFRTRNRGGKSVVYLYHRFLTKKHQ